MADPYSISGGVVGVVSLGLTVSQGLIAYYGPWKSYDDEISGFTTRLEGLQHSLQGLHEFISPEQELDLPSDQYKKIVSLQLKSCEDACQKLEGMLDKCKSTDTSPFVRKHDWLRLKRASYPFKKETLVTLSQYVSGLQDNLNLSLQLLNGALITQQQKQIQRLASTATAINVQTTRILTVVEQRNATPPMTQEMLLRSAGSKSGLRPILEPRTLNHLCNQQTLINSSLRGPRRLQASSSQLAEKYCTCNRRLRYSPRFSFSVSAGHRADCPLYVDGHQTMGISARYTFCNRLLGISVHFIMTLTRGAGALAISPMLQFHSVVPDDSPAFRLLLDLDGPDRLQDPNQILESTQWSILKMFHNRKAAPSDRLADGTTLLHALLRSSSYLQESSYLYALREFVSSLIDAGVPVAEKTLHGDSVADEVLSRMSQVHLGREMPSIAGQMLQKLFLSGSELASLTEVHYEEQLYHTHHQLPGFWHRKTALVQSLGVQNMLGDIQFSPIEMAIVTQSEEGLRECLGRANDGFSTSPLYTPGFGTLLAWCLGWIPGMRLVLESPLPRDANSISNFFVIACLHKDIDSASLLLEHNPEITLYALQCAVLCRDNAVLRATISQLAAQRHTLQEVALRHVPAENIGSLELPESGLLDTKALFVYDALVQHGVDPLPCGSPDGRSVYTAISAGMPAAELLNIAELLYAAGFTDLNQRGKAGNTAIADMSLYCWSLVSFATMADWMICRGADLYTPSRHGYSAIFYVASEFGTQLYTTSYKCYKKSCLHGITSSCELEMILSTHFAGVDLIPTVLLDDTTDDCLCACSQRGCSPLTQLLRAYYRPNRLGVIGHLQEIVSRTLNTDSWKTTVSAMVRYITFEALGMTHTCHVAFMFDVTCLDSEETSEIRDEESAMIVQLNELMVEFDRKYDELDVGIRQFLEGYWHTRMEEVLQEKHISRDEAMKVREIGVIISDADDSSSDDGED